MIDLINNDFQYNGVRYDYDTVKDCETHGCDSICRCSTIIATRVTEVDIEELSNSIYDLYFTSGKTTKRHNDINSILYGTSKELDLYCIDRVLRHYESWDKHSWDIGVIPGYYGEEISDVRLKRNIAEKVQNDLDVLMFMETPKEKIEFLLNLEYGSILPELTNKNYEIIVIDKDLIVFGNDEHYQKIKSEDLDHYFDHNYKGIKGLVVKTSSGKYRIIDGYHRIYCTEKDKVRVIFGKNG